MTDKYIEIKKSIVMFEPEHDSNLICIELYEGLIFVDAGTRDDAALKFRMDMEKKFNKKTMALFLTHYHSDHYCGMSAFKDVEIIAAKKGYNEFIDALNSYLTKENRVKSITNDINSFKARNQEIPPRYKIVFEYYPKVELFAPTKIVEDKLIFGKKSRKIIFKVVGGHTNCSSYIYAPFAKTLIIGDNLATDPARVGGCFFGGISEKTIEALKSTENFDVETVIPGHGPITDMKYLITARKYFENLLGLYNVLIREGKTAKEAIIDPRMPEFYDAAPNRWKLILEIIFRNLEKEQNEKTIDEVMSKFKDANRKNHPDEILKFYTENFSILYPTGFSIIGSEIYKMKHLKSIKILEIEYGPQVKYFLDEKFVEKGMYFKKYEINGLIKNHEVEYLRIWEKEEDSWKINLDIILSEKDY